MDRRTILFVISLSLTLLAVNMFFEQRNQESLKQTHEYTKAQKTQKRDALEAEITQHTAKPNNFPLTKIYADAKNTQFLTSGLLLKNALITLPWSETLPKKVYSKDQEFELSYSSEIGSGPVVYEKKAQTALPIVNLPFIGSYELQLITLFPNEPEKTPLITLAKFTDGQFSIPLLTLISLNQELNLPEHSEKYAQPGNSIVMLKNGKEYYPVATYNSQANTLITLEELADLKTEFVTSELAPITQKMPEQFFVLENETQQLVFSSRGGALAEINLPFESEKNKKSVVKEIEFDRNMVQNHPFNALFPAHPYFTSGENASGPFKTHSKGQLGGYHPLIRRDLIQTGKRKSIKILPEFYAMNIVSEYPELAELSYKVTHFDAKTIVFEAVQRNRKITKTFSLNEGNKNAPYCFDLEIKIEGESKGLWLTSGVPEVEMISNAAAPTMKYRITRNGKPEVNAIEMPSEATTVSDIYPDWLCNSNGFLGIIMDPLSTIDSGYRVQYVSGTQAPSCLIEIDEEHERYKAKDLPGYMVMLPLNSKGGVMKFRVYAGPFASNILKQVDTTFSNEKTGYNPDYIASQSFHGWFSFISQPFAKFLLILMNFFHAVTGSWALSIVLLTIALRLMLYPLNAWSTKSMLKMQIITPEVQRIQEKYKKEPQKAQLEILNLYRENGVNPISGCLPLLIQMPFLIGMFDLLKSTFELRGASFIPGWIDNLAAPDVLFSWSTPIFFIGTEFHLLPFLLGGVMFLQQKVSSSLPTDGRPLTDQQKQQKMMGTMMTGVFTIMFYNFPSGLNIYWLSSMLLGIMQQWWTQKRFKNRAVLLKALPAPRKNDKR